VPDELDNDVSRLPGALPGTAIQNELVKHYLASRLKEPDKSSDADWSVYKKMKPTVQKIIREAEGGS
jgi:hypothetical protein